MAQDSNRPRILITGITGQVGGELAHTLTPFGEIVAPTRAEMDLSDASSVAAFIRNVRPRWIVNAGAYTAVDKAESEHDLAFTINAEAVRTIGIEAHALGAGVLHFSSDYVFDGHGTEPFVETDPIGPLSVYGASKLAGEKALHDTGAAALTFRTSWVYGATGKNFLRTILKLARERDELRIVADQHGAPTWSRDLARMAAHVIAQCERVAIESSASITHAASQFSGVYHAAGSGETTWAGFAEQAIALTRAQDPSAKLASIVPISTAEYPTPAVRPPNSRLNTEKLARTFNWRMMDWHESLEQVLLELNRPSA